MSRTKLAGVLPVLFIVIFVAYLVTVVRKKPRVLILHSYNVDYSWVQEVSTGINRVLEGKPYTVRWHYMDTKRHPDERYKALAGHSARHVIDQWQPHVLVAVADNAQQLVARHYLDDANMAIVFAGVTENPATYGYDDASNVTGILERWPMEVIHQAIEEIFVPRLTEDRKLRVHHIGDRSTTGLIIAHEIVTHLPKWDNETSSIEITSKEINYYPEWQAEILRANTDPRVDLLLFSLYHTLKRGPDDEDIVPPREVMEWTSDRLCKPSLGGWGFFAEQGGMMAIGVSAYEQGEEAARMAAAIIDEHKKPGDIPIKRSKQFLVYLREASLKEHGVTVPFIFESFARATNNYIE